MYRKINVYVNNSYIYSTNKFRRCKDAIKALKEEKKIMIASTPKNKYFELKESDKIKAFFD